MRYADTCDPPSFPRLRGRCPECGAHPCRCEDIALEAPRCWYNLFSISRPPCPKPGRWIGPPELLALVPAMRSWLWCDEHRHADDVVAEEVTT